MVSTTRTDSLARPVRVGGLVLDNPIAVAPMSRVSAGPSGIPTARMGEYYASFARGGFGLVITEGTYTDATFSRAYPDQPGLATEDQVRGWSEVVSAVHAAGGRIVAQLMHAGALSQVLESTIAPSPLPPRGTKMPEYGGGDGPFPVPRAASADDLDGVVRGFAAAAGAAVRAGFDGVEVHGANGYLLDQFVTDYTNLRDDGYGGSASGRARLTREVVEAVRRSVGDDAVVGLRLSQSKVNDVHHRWSRPEAEELLRAIAGAPLDYVHVASEGRDWQEGARVDEGMTLTRLARDVVGVPVMANGGLGTADRARGVLDAGEADLVVLGRPAIVNPDWPSRVVEGRAPRPWDPAALRPDASLASQDRWAEVNRAGRD